MTMNDPKQQMDVVNKVENAREETLRAIAISDRQMKQMLFSKDSDIRNDAQQIYLTQIRVSPTLQRNPDPKTNREQPFIPLFESKDQLLKKQENKLLIERKLVDKKGIPIRTSLNLQVVREDSEYKKLFDSLIDQTK
jgi:hypothetical protein